jgi:hypothetical protein
MHSMLYVMASEYRSAYRQFQGDLIGTDLGEDPLWDTCVSRTAFGAMNYGVTAIFAEKHFPDSSRQEVGTLLL